jgi:prevent-host-death family protein
MPTWQLQEAKARFSELMRGAATGPQTITVHGRRAAVVLSADDYDRLKGSKPSLTEFLRMSPLAGVRLNIERDLSLPRDVELMNPWKD